MGLLDFIVESDYWVFGGCACFMSWSCKYLNAVKLYAGWQ